MRTIALQSREDISFSKRPLKRSLFQLIQELEPHGLYRVKNVAIYFTSLEANAGAVLEVRLHRQERSVKTR